jgi:hypothetical protein
MLLEELHAAVRESSKACPRSWMANNVLRIAAYPRQRILRQRSQVSWLQWLTRTLDASTF